MWKEAQVGNSMLREHCNSLLARQRINSACKAMQQVTCNWLLPDNGLLMQLGNAHHEDEWYCAASFTPAEAEEPH